MQTLVEDGKSILGLLDVLDAPHQAIQLSSQVTFHTVYLRTYPLYYTDSHTLA